MDMKRIYRNDMGQAQKDKIAAANTGKHHTPETKRKISQSMCKYWAGLPFKPATDTGNTSGTTTGIGTVPGVHVLFLVGGNLHRPNTSNYIVKI